MNFVFVLIFNSTGNYLLLEVPKKRVPILILDVNDHMTMRHKNAHALESYDWVLFHIDQLVFGGALDEGVEIHMHNGVFVYDDGELVFREEEDDALVVAEVNTDNGCANEHRTTVVYNTSEQRDLPLGHHPFPESQSVVTQLKGSPQ